MNIFENLENLNVSEECFDEIMGIVEELLSEGYKDPKKQALKDKYLSDQNYEKQMNSLNRDYGNDLLDDDVHQQWQKRIEQARKSNKFRSGEYKQLRWDNKKDKVEAEKELKERPRFHGHTASGDYKHLQGEVEGRVAKYRTGMHDDKHDESNKANIKKRVQNTYHRLYSDPYDEI